MKTNLQSLQQKKWYVIGSESKGRYSHHDPIKFLAKSIESSLWDYSDAYILVTRNIAVTRAIAASAGTQPQRKQELTAATQVLCKNCAQFKDCRTKTTDTFVD